MDVSDNKASAKNTLGSRIVMLVIAAGLLLPLCFNWSQFAPYNLQGGASWIASSILLVLTLVFLWVNRRKQWLCLPESKHMFAFIGICVLLTLLTVPHIFTEPELFFQGFSLLVVFIVVLWFALRRYSLIISVPFLVIAMFETGAYYRYKTLFNSMVLAEAIECSKEELLAYATVTNIGLLVIGILVVTGILYALCRVMGAMSKRSIAGVMLALVVSVYILYPFVPISCTSFSQLGVIGTFQRTKRMFKDIKRASNAVTAHLDSLPSPADKPSTLTTLKGNEGCVIVFHIGESVRADRCGFNGYERNTTPNLSANPRLINWKRCVASTPTTVTCLSVLMTNARRDTEDISEGNQEMHATCGSVMDLFKANGFAVQSFFGALSRQSLRADKVLRMLTSATEARHYTNNDVMETVEQVKQCLQKTGNKNVFLFINNEGSHSPFYMYDQKNPPFTPALQVLYPSPRYEADVRNAYDNTVHYNDAFVHRVLQQLAGRPYVYVYVSDHGEYLGDYEGIWGRARATAERDFFFRTQGGAGVSAFAVASPEYEKLNPQFAQAVAAMKNSQRLTIGHEHFFHTLLGLVGMQTPYYNAELDLCSPEVKPYTGPEPEDWPEHLKNDK